MVYKCKICGGQTTVDAKSGIAVCEYCGTKQALPLFAEDSERLLYDRGNNYLLHSEYDKAENVFNQLLTIKPGAAELYWDLVLCKYGVTYVKDPKTGKYIPTCNRTHYTPIFSDENYKKAIELSSGEKKALFEEDAKTIDNIQKGIIAVSKKEKPFDIFISYKETDANGIRTEDSIAAQDLYEKLTDAGYKVFFARITLEDKLGTEYEPYIYAALYSSKVMLTICSSRENIEAVWVKNEWSRFLSLRQQDPGKTLIPLYFNMEKDDLPEEFGILATQDMKQEDFEQELLRGIKKMIPLPIMKAKRRKKILKITTITAATIVATAGIVAAIVLPKKLEEKRLREEAQALEAANAAAYQEALALYEKADYLAAADAFVALGDYEDAAAMAEECVLKKQYTDAMQLYYDGNYPEAAWAFRDVGEYSDAPQMRDKAEQAWRDKLATVATYVSGWEWSGGTYFITANGQVKNVLTSAGTQHEGIEINSHGKITSIAEGYPLFALYEDGYVFNSAKNNNMEADWVDVIQITPQFNATSVALKNNGTVVFGDIQSRNYADCEDSWLKPVSEWKGIVSLSWGMEKFGYEGTLSAAMLIGIDVKGDVHCVYYANSGVGGYLTDTEIVRVKEMLQSMHNIQTVEVCFDSTREGRQLNCIVLNQEGNLTYYANGETKVREKTTYKDVLLRDGFEALGLDEKGRVQNLNTEKIVDEDVVYIDGAGHFVKRSGTIVDIEDGKTKVRDTWLEGIG